MKNKKLLPILPIQANNEPFNTVSKPLIKLDLQTFARKFKVALSDGHGTLTAGKRTPDGYRENYFNEAVVDFLKVELIRCGFDVLLVAPTDADTSLTARTNAANKWGADVYVSVHYNALASKWRSGEGGIETYYYPGSASGKKLADALHKEVIKGTPLKNRGVKSANLHEVRESAMPAALLELGFMDIKKEAELMKSTAYRKECAVEIAQGLCNYFGVKYVPEVAEAPKGAVVIGSVKITTGALNVRTSPSLSAAVVTTVEKDQTFDVYQISGNFYRISKGWISNPSEKYANFTKKVVPIPKPAAKPKPVETNGEVYRVIVDGKQIGAYSEDSNIIAQAKAALSKGAENIKLEAV
jgi:N-acetylmuramoyl-L-alanine amidase